MTKLAHIHVENALSPRYGRGWHCLGEADEYRDGKLHTLNVFGSRLLAFATSRGEISVLDAHCPHMGADLSQGTIENDRVVCAFQHWQYDASGKCVEIPYCKRIPPKAKTRAWQTCEVNNLLFVWNNPEGKPPADDVVIPHLPEMDSDEWLHSWHMDKLIIENVQLAVVIKNKPEIRIPITVTLPDMGPVGTDEKGLTGVELAFALSAEIVRGLTDSVVRSSDQIYRDATKQGMKIADDVKKHVKGYESSVKDAVKSWESGDKNEAIQKGQEILDNVLKDEKIKETGKELKNLWNNLRGK